MLVSKWVTDILFNFFHYKNIYSNKTKNTEQESDTHPAPMARKKMIREYILSQYSEKDKVILNYSYDIIDNIFAYHIENYSMVS